MTVSNIQLDPFATANADELRTILTAIVAAANAGDVAVSQALATYQTTNNTRLTAVEALADPKKIEDAIKGMLLDPDMAQVLAGSISQVPGTNLTIGSVVKALMDAPVVTSAELVRGPGSSVIGADLVFDVAGVSTPVTFLASTADAPAVEGLDYTVRTVTFTGQLAQVPYTFTFTGHVKAGAIANVTFTQVIPVGYTPIVFNLSSQYAAVVPVQIEVPDVANDGSDFVQFGQTGSFGASN